MSESEQTTAPAQNRKPKRRRRKPRRRQSSWDLRQFQVPAVAGKWRFHDFDLPLPLMRAIHAQGFEYCTPIQAEALRQTLLGGDIVGKAQTGTGKTAAFLISVMAYFLEEPTPNGQKPGAPRALIIAPTRELALQIEKDAKALARFTQLNVASVVGGMDYQKQRESLGSKIDILVATPGRLLDFHQKRDIDLNEVEVLVLDEADRMLSMGFIPDVKRIIRYTPKKEERQTFLFSATFTDDILNLASQWTLNPAHVEIEVTVENQADIDQRVYLVSDDDKQRLLVNLLQQESFERVMVFGNRRDLVRKLDDLLKKAGVSAAMLSGDVPQNQRIKTLESSAKVRFRYWSPLTLLAVGSTLKTSATSSITPCPKTRKIMYTVLVVPDAPVLRACRLASLAKRMLSHCRKSNATSMTNCPAYIRRKVCSKPHAG